MESHEADDARKNASVEYRKGITSVNNSRLKKKLANRPFHRLQSIRYDATHFCRGVVEKLTSNEASREFPILANERCGTWYSYPITVDCTCMDVLYRTQASSSRLVHSCYFKSTDGHYGTWNFSLKRLNLGVVRLAAQHGGCIIFDASGSKIFPDSMSRTIPIWACVLNRIALRFRRDMQQREEEIFDNWDSDIFTPSCIVDDDERVRIQDIIDERVEVLYRSKAIVDPEWLVATLSKPLRPVWKSPGWSLENTDIQELCQRYLVLVCVSCSDVDKSGQSLIAEVDGATLKSFIYSPGAADDHSLWSRGLTPQLFWRYAIPILDTSACEDDADRMIDQIVGDLATHDNHVNEEKLGMARTSSSSHDSFHFIGELGVAVGSRRAGRPPECWEEFDAVLNVTDQEYDGMRSNHHKYYLQLPVQEGKKDRIDLERWMAVGIIFIVNCVVESKKVLVHCAQGRDRSVSILLSCITLCTNLELPLRWSMETMQNLSFSFLKSFQDESSSRSTTYYCNTGLSVEAINSLQGQAGRDLLFQWIRSEKGVSDETPLASKESLRLALLLIQQDREIADPSRATMQKVNRFFMSKSNYY